MKVYAVIDTNVLVSALFTKHPDTAPAQILERLFDTIISRVVTPNEFLDILKALKND